jgi:hypothetical protein
VAREQRKLATIIAVDVVGYSRLMGLDDRARWPVYKWFRQSRGSSPTADPAVHDRVGHYLAELSDNKAVGTCLKGIAPYYSRVRTHLALGKVAPLSRSVQQFGFIDARPILGGLHHEYGQT